MAQRMIEAVISDESGERFEAYLRESDFLIGYWSLKTAGDQTLYRILVPLERSEELSDGLFGAFSADSSFRLTFFDVEATVPQPESEKKKEQEKKERKKRDGSDGERTSRYTLRISRDELYNNISDEVRLSLTYLTTVLLSVIVAAIGLMKGDVAVIIGAMVIAPLLAPNVALSLAATLGDIKLGREALVVNLSGLVLALLVSFLIGWIFQPSPEVEQIGNRTLVNVGDIILALAAGAAGVLAFTRGVAAGVIGVMVAVALLPPLVVSGLMAGAGEIGAAVGAMLLTMANVCGLNLAGIATFLVQGVQPREWWETEKAKAATRNAMLFWFLLLGIFTLIILLR